MKPISLYAQHTVRPISKASSMEQGKSLFQEVTQ